MGRNPTGPKAIIDPVMFAISGLNVRIGTPCKDHPVVSSAFLSEWALT
jgi:hypothetical protein